MEEKIKKLLNKIIEILSVIDEDYVSILFNILNGDSEYDKLFFKYVNDYDLDERTAKNDCIKYLSCHDIFKINNKQISNHNELVNSSFDNIYDEICNSLMSYYESIVDLKKGCIDKRCENLHIKLYLLAIYCKYYNYYLNYISEYELFDYSDPFYEIYNDIINSSNMFEMIYIFNYNVDNILITFNNYISLSKSIIDEINIFSISTNFEKILFKIYPPTVFSFRKHYGYKFDDEKIDSIIVGEKTLEIINDLIRDYYSCNCKKIYENALIIINSKKNDENIYSWMMFLITNVYENLILHSNSDIECKYISIIENCKDYKLLINNKNFMCFILKKFYEYNSLVFDEQSLKDLNKNLSQDKKKVLKKINPFFNQEENYL